MERVSRSPSSADPDTSSQRVLRYILRSLKSNMGKNLERVIRLKSGDDRTLRNVDLIFLNFQGKEGKYNEEGERSFAILLDEKLASIMYDEGWNVKELKQHDDGDRKFYI